MTGYKIELKLFQAEIVIVLFVIKLFSSKED